MKNYRRSGFWDNSIHYKTDFFSNLGSLAPIETDTFL